MFTRKVIAASAICVALLLPGCGSRDGVSADIPGGDTGYETPVQDPGAGMPGAPVVQPSPPAPMQPITATVSEKKKFGGSILCLFLCNKKLEAQIAVTNPNPVQASATLTITFSKGGSSVENLSQTVDLGPGEPKTVEVKSTKSADDVTVFVTMNEPAGGANPGIPGSSPYGSPYGSPNGSPNGSVPRTGGTPAY